MQSWFQNNLVTRLFDNIPTLCNYQGQPWLQQCTMWSFSTTKMAWQNNLAFNSKETKVIILSISDMCRLHNLKYHKLLQTIMIIVIIIICCTCCVYFWFKSYSHIEGPPSSLLAPRLSLSWTFHRSTSLLIVSLTIKIVFSISATIFSQKSFSSIFPSSFNTSFIHPPKTLITSSITLILKTGFLFLISNENCLQLVFFFSLFFSILFSCGHGIWHIQNVFFCFSSSIKSGFIDVVIFCKLNSKSHISFAWEISKTCPLFLIPFHILI